MGKTVPGGAGGATDPAGARPVARPRGARTLEDVIGYLEGTMRCGVVMTSAGVGYRVATSEILADGAAVSLWVTTVVRENDLSLYGFPTRDDQAVFEAIVRVPRVGPQMALALLRDVGAGRLARAVAERDPVPLTAARGVGRKVAELIVSSVALPEGIDAGGDADGDREMVASLEALGFGAEDVRDALATARAARGDGASEADLLAEVLDVLNARR